MIWTIAIIFALVWVIGLVTSTMLGGAIHGLLGVAVVLLLIGAFRAGKRSEQRRNGDGPGTAEVEEKGSVADEPAKSQLPPQKGSSA